MGNIVNLDERDDTGLTVLRLIVIVTGLAIVVAALGIGLGTRRSVGDETAKRDARAASDAAFMYAAETGKAPTVHDLEVYSPSIDYESLGPGDDVAVQGKVYVRAHGDVAELAARSGETCFWVQRSTTVTRYAEGSCDGDPADLVFRDHW
jgi:hypothetical protein